MHKNRILPTVAVLVLLPTALLAQKLTGIWKGYFVTKDQSQYKIEVQITEKNGQLAGVTYSYLDVSYYGKATMTGRVEKKNGKVTLQEIKTVEVRSREFSETCLMQYLLDYSRSGQEEYLEGNFTSKYEKNGENTKKGGDCGGGIVFLRRVNSSDFNSDALSKAPPATKKVFFNEAPVIKSGTTTPTVATNKGTTTAKPKTTAKVNTVRESTPTVEKKKVEVSNAIATNNTSEKSKEETSSHSTNAKSIVIKEEPEPVDNNRQNELVKELTLNTRQAIITIYDNGEIDGDTVSVFLNGNLVISKKRLSTVPLKLSLTLSELHEVQELTFVAENLGRIPPNTALMIVDTGQQQYRLQVLSSDKNNAVFRFRYQPSR
ncbi:MAG: hypothetical protein ACKO41_05070 [Sphingomonadales bacterium]